MKFTSDNGNVKRLPVKLKKVPKREWPEATFDPNRISVWLGPDYLAQVFKRPDGIYRISVNRTIRNAEGWVDGIPWDDLQDIKNAVGFVGRDAVEVYPIKKDVVNVAPMRHLWVLPEPLEFAWRADSE